VVVVIVVAANTNIGSFTRRTNTARICILVPKASNNTVTPSCRAHLEIIYTRVGRDGRQHYCIFGWSKTTTNSDVMNIKIKKKFSIYNSVIAHHL
jgi:hypothetical protein